MIRRSSKTALPNRVSQRKRRSAARAGMTLSGGTSWPVHDEKHALIALKYMAKGRGDTTKYVSYLKKLSRLYPKRTYPKVAELFKSSGLKLRSGCDAQK